MQATKTRPAALPRLWAARCTKYSSLLATQRTAVAMASICLAMALPVLAQTPATKGPSPFVDVQRAMEHAAAARSSSSLSTIGSRALPGDHEASPAKTRGHSQAGVIGITTFAGCCETTGPPAMYGYKGDGGLANVAEMDEPFDVRYDSSGNVYIADSANNVVRMVNASTGIITTVAGNGFDAGSCHGTDGCLGGYSGDGGPATAAEMYLPSQIAIDSSNNLYINDLGNCIIREVNASTGIITTVAGTPDVCGYGGDGGAATAAELYYPEGIAVDGSGNLYISDRNNCLIRKVTAATGIINTIAGTATGAGTFENCGYAGDGGPATAAELYFIYGSIALDASGNIFIPDTENDVVRMVNPAGIISTVAGIADAFGYSGDGGPATEAELYYPTTIAVDTSGNFYFGDAFNNVVREVMGGTINTVVGDGFGAGTGTGGYTGDGGPATSAELFYTGGVTVNPEGQLVVADVDNNVARATGILTTSALTSSMNPSGLGQTVTFTATVSGSSPTGEVAWSSNTGCAPSALSSGMATCMVTFTAVGAYPITANYLGDGYNLPSNASLEQLVFPAVSVTTVTSSANPSMVGAPVTFTATITGDSPTGTVTFNSNGSPICSSVAVSGGTATCTYTFTAAGTYSIVAVYSGDSNNTSSTDSTSQVVSLTSAAITVTSSANPSAVGAAVTFTATVTGNSPTGTVDFTSNGSSIGCDSVALSNGTATCTYTFTTAGTYSIVAVYSGDSNNASSTGSTAQVVSSSVTTTSATIQVASPSPNYVSIKAGQSVSLQFGISATGVSSANLTCSVSPAGPTCALSASTISLSGGSGTVSATITTTSSEAALHHRGGGWMFAMGLAGLLLLPAGSRARRQRAMMLLGGILLLAAIGFAGCGGSTQSAPYLVSVTAMDPVSGATSTASAALDVHQ